MKDIYYIETIKSTHFCEIVHRKGKGKLRADITPLEQELKGQLFRSKASTLVNLELVEKVDTKNRILYFQNHIYCSYAQRAAKELKRLLRIQSYRKLRKRKSEGGTDG